VHTKRSQVLLLAATILVSRPVPAASQEAWRGAALFHQYCASCHGEKGTGKGPVAAYLTVPPADLTRTAERADGTFPRDQITRIIAGEENPPGHGTRTMPVWGEQLQEGVIGSVRKQAVARGRIAFLVDYLESLQGTDEKGFENTVIPGNAPPGKVPGH
jgi:mono/diheme cytochrome c family protein